MGKIISEDATNIFYPQNCDVLVDDVEQRLVKKHGIVLITIQGTWFMTYKAFYYDNRDTELLTKRVE